MRLPFASRFASRLPGLWPGLACGLLMWGATALGWTAGLEGLALDGLFRARGPRDADPRVVIVAVDDAAVVRAGEKTGAGWPLPRAYYARAIRELKHLGASVVAFDVLFAEPGPDPRQDLQLARESSAAGNVVPACAFQVPAQPIELGSHLAAAPLPARFAVGNAAQLRQMSVRRAVWATAPLPALARSARALGHVNVFPEASGTLRRVPHLLLWRGQLFSSLSLAGAAQFLGQKAVLRAKNREIELAGRHIPLDESGFTLINWIGATGSYPKWSLNQLLDGQVPQAAIRGRIVVLGVTALGAYEHRATPFAGGIPSVDFQANALDDILSNRLLRPVPAPLSTLLLWLFPLGCALATARRGGKGAWPVLGSMGLLALLALQLLRHNWVLPIGAPLLGGALAFAGAAASGYRREWEALTRFDAASSSLARGTTLLGAALGTSTRDEAQLLEIIRETALQTLGARQVWVVLDDPKPGDANPESERDPRALLAARQAQCSAKTWIFPAPRARRAPAVQPLLSPAEKTLMRGQTLIAAPLPRTFTGAANASATPLASTPLASTPLASTPLASTPRREFHGALVALGTRDGAPFSARDAAMLETLAEGAALALENFRYARTLRGRIESANLELEGAHRLLAEQSAKLFVAVESIDAALIITNSRGDAAFVNASAPEILLRATPAVGENVAQALSRGELSPWADWFQNLAPQPDGDEASGDEARGVEARGADGNHLEGAQSLVAPPDCACHGPCMCGALWVEGNFAAKKRSDLGGFEAQTLRGEISRGRQHLTAQFTPLWSGERRFLGAMLVVSDVTAHRELAAMKTEFVGFVAHELRTPLTTILGYTSLLETMGAHFSPAETRDITEVIARHCRRMNAMISDLLDISRLESGQPLPIRREQFDLAALCARLVREQKSYLNPHPPLQIEFCCDWPALWFPGDCERLEQVVLNLLSNAVKYSPEGGTITLSLSQNEREIHLNVRDEGLGLTRAQMAPMFQKFYRTEDVKARGIKGNGLGLNLVKQIIEAHGGSIGVESARDEGERGATFRINLPVG